MRQAPQGTVSAAEIFAAAIDYVNQDRYLSLSEACKYLSLSERTIRELLPEIRPSRIGRKLLFKKSKLDAWAQTHETGRADLVVDATAEADAHRILSWRGNQKG